jgi:hypothetical protein
MFHHLLVVDARNSVDLGMARRKQKAKHALRGTAVVADRIRLETYLQPPPPVFFNTNLNLPSKEKGGVSLHGEDYFV